MWISLCWSRLVIPVWHSTNSLQHQLGLQCFCMPVWWWWCFLEVPSILFPPHFQLQTLMYVSFCDLTRKGTSVNIGSINFICFSRMASLSDVVKHAAKCLGLSFSISDILNILLKNDISTAYSFFTMSLLSSIRTEKHTTHMHTEVNKCFCLYMFSQLCCLLSLQNDTTRSSYQSFKTCTCLQICAGL